MVSIPPGYPPTFRPLSFPSSRVQIPADKVLRIAVANWWHTNWYASSLSQVNFLVFTSVWTLLALVYLVVVPWRFSDTVAHHKFAILAAEAVTMLFWFAGFIALAVFLTDRVCYGIVCGAVIAGNVFAAFEW